MVTSLMGPFVATPLIRWFGKFNVLVAVESIYAIGILLSGLLGA